MPGDKMLDRYLLTYVVELTTKQTFTARKKFDDEPDAVRFVNQLRGFNKKLKYKRYSGGVLYLHGTEVKKYIM